MWDADATARPTAAELLVKLPSLAKGAPIFVCLFNYYRFFLKKKHKHNNEYV
jgi:hypothetical protein